MKSNISKIQQRNTPTDISAPVSTNISDHIISFTASIAMCILIITPALMAIIAMFKQSIDFTMNLYIPMVKHLAFPFACSIVLVIYILKIYRYIRINKNISAIHNSDGLILKNVNSNSSIPKKTPVTTIIHNIKDLLFQNPTFIIFFVVSLLIVVSQFHNGIEYAILGTSAVTLGESFGMELGYFVFILFGATQIKVESHKRNLLRTHCFVSTILVDAAFILLNTQVESSFFSDWTPRFSSIFSNTNYYGYYLSISVPIAAAAFVYEKQTLWKVFSGLAFVSNAVALSFDNTLGSWIGAFFSIIFIVITHFIIEKKINWQTIILIPIFLLCIFIPSHTVGSFETNISTLFGDVSKISQGGEEAASAGSGRWRIWKESMEIIYDNSVLGIGFEGVKQRDYIGPPYNIRPHNEFIQYAMFHGVPMAFLYFVGCLSIFIRALRKKKEINGATLVSLAGAFGYLISSFFGLTVFGTAYFLFIFLGMGYVNESNKTVNDKKHNKAITIILCFIILITILLTAIFSNNGKGYYKNGIQDFSGRLESNQ